MLSTDEISNIKYLIINYNIYYNEMDKRFLGVPITFSHELHHAIPREKTTTIPYVDSLSDNVVYDIFYKGSPRQYCPVELRNECARINFRIKGAGTTRNSKTDEISKKNKSLKADCSMFLDPGRVRSQKLKWNNMLLLFHIEVFSDTISRKSFNFKSNKTVNSFLHFKIECLSSNAHQSHQNDIVSKMESIKMFSKISLKCCINYEVVTYFMNNRGSGKKNNITEQTALYKYILSLFGFRIFKLKQVGPPVEKSTANILRIKMTHCCGYVGIFLSIQLLKKLNPRF
ncbi:hypothetical protein QTP88_007432 [Uroleucon formosanum]